MCIHGDKTQPERDWVLTGKTWFIRSIIWASIGLIGIGCCRDAFLCDPQLISWHFLSPSIEFRSGKAPILIATDVASRGLGMYCVLRIKAQSLGMNTNTDIFLQWAMSRTPNCA